MISKNSSIPYSSACYSIPFTENSPKPNSLLFMNYIRTLLLFTLLGLLPFAVNSQNAANAGNRTFTFQLEKVVDGLTAPVASAHANDGSGRLFIAEQPGQIRIIKNGRLVPEPFLDLKSRMVNIPSGYSEMGLLGLAFHPDYRQNGRFYVYYSAPSSKSGVNHTSVVAEYRVSDNPDRAATNEKILMEIDQPESNHNGGQLAFGPDGYLYIALGDGGGAGDKHGRIGHGQDITTLLGSILRIDVNRGNPYAVPADNPFVNREGQDEIYAYGLRNPWRFSFDRQTGQLFAADVGQNQYEEVNIIERGRNYGWRIMEGFHVYDQNLKQPGQELAPPISEYDHSEGISITGGYVYRGTQFPALQGRYIFGDWTGKVFYLEPTDGPEWNRRPAVFAGKNSHDIGLRINSFGEDEKGEIYLLVQDEVGPRSRTGSVQRLVLAGQGAAAR
jgi:glucose/arabinose dehydrogenase